MGSETCLKNNDKWYSLTFRAKKSCLWPYLRALRASWRKRGVFSGFARSPRAVWVLMGPTRTLNDKIITVLVKICPFYASPWKYFIFSCAFCLIAPKFLVLYRGDIVSTYVLTDARNALLFLAFTRMSYSMPCGENKENKAYICWIFFNLRPNEIAQIIEHLQKGTFVLPGRLMSISNSLSNIISWIPFKRKFQWVQKLVWKTATNDVLWLSGPKSPA